jgi:parallel beta-helix repeat protein
VQRLTDELEPGETGCLRRGTYREDVIITGGGRSGRPVELTAYPGERAMLAGLLLVDGADHVVVSGLWLDGRNGKGAPSPQVLADDVVFRQNDVTNARTEICFSVGTRAGEAIVAHRVTIQANRIHDCGERPETNLDHGIYLENTVGARIIGNWIYDNADRGVQLFPSAQGSLVAGNVIDGNGQGVLFGGGEGVASGDNIVRDNAITNSRLRANVEAFYPDGLEGFGNVVRRNCLHGAQSVDVAQTAGFSAFDNLRRPPAYLDREAKDFRIAPGGDCWLVVRGAPGDFLDLLRDLLYPAIPGPPS